MLSYWHSSRYPPRSVKNSKGPKMDAPPGGGGVGWLGKGQGHGWARGRAMGQGMDLLVHIWVCMGMHGYACAQASSSILKHPRANPRKPMHTHMCTGVGPWPGANGGGPWPGAMGGGPGPGAMGVGLGQGPWVWAWARAMGGGPGRGWWGGGGGASILGPFEYIRGGSEQSADLNP